MDIESQSPYQKLATTPLARDTKLCCLNAPTCMYLLAFLSILVGPLPCIIVGYLIITHPQFDYTKAWLYNEDDPDHDMEYFTKRNIDQRVPRIAFGIMGITIAVIHIIGNLILLYGAYTARPGAYSWWTATFFCQICFGKGVFSFLMFSLGIYYSKIILFLIVPDIIISVFVHMAVGQLALINRNRTYMSFAPVKYKINPDQSQAGAALLGQVNYPRQMPCS